MSDKPRRGQSNRKTNIVLIGMPGAGKSTVGVVLAKYLSKKFIDTDIAIQNRYHCPLQDLVDQYGYLKLREIEENEILSLNIQNAVIAPGGSVVYSQKAMDFLRRDGILVYLKVELDELMRRVGNLHTRGIANAGDQSFADIYYERQPLYEKYCDVLIDCGLMNHEEVIKKIIEKIRQPWDGD